MSGANERMILDFLKSMGLAGEFRDSEPGVREVTVNHQGTSFTVYLYSDPEVVRLQLAFAYLNPKTAAPLMRRLLDLNLQLGSGCYFALVEPDDLLLWGTTRPLEGLDRVEFTGLCDQLAAGYWEFCPNLIREFQLQTEPA